MNKFKPVHPICQTTLNELPGINAAAVSKSFLPDVILGTRRRV